MRLLEIKSHEIKKLEGHEEIKEALAKCAIISHRWGSHELSLQLYEERMKSSGQKDQFNHPGDTSVLSEAESQGFLKTARACLKAKQQESIEPKMDLEYIWMDTCCMNKQRT